jgi:hypothetical protein
LVTSTLLATLVVYVLDAISQYPKRWSSLSHHCWMWAIAVLVVRGTIGLMDGEAGPSIPTAKTEQEPGQADSGPQIDAHMVQTTQYLLSAFSAMVVVCALPRWIDVGAGFVKTPGQLSPDERTTLYLAVCTFAWSSLYFYRSQDIEEKPAYEAINLDPLDEPIAPSHSIQPTSWIKVFLSVIAFVPLLLAGGKHTMSGTALQSIYDVTVAIVSTGRRATPRWLIPSLFISRRFQSQELLLIQVTGDLDRRIRQPSHPSTSSSPTSASQRTNSAKSLHGSVAN